jgi:tetratricopeptide (TPR) repeat protein
MTATNLREAPPPAAAAAADPRATALPSLAEEVLVHAQEGRAVVQEFCPLAASLEWELGQEYLRQRGSQAFLGDASPVPYVVHNDGTLSRSAAEVLFASLKAAEKDWPLEEEICVLELGIGVGLFARYFLDAFRELCARHGTDYYDRLCYVGADRSERMLRDACRHGVFAGHPGHYRLRLADALDPAATLLQDPALAGGSGRPFRAVFLNYLLDCLPAAVLEWGEPTKQLCVRTCVARNVRLEDFTELTPQALAERVKSGDAQARQDLLEVYGLFASEYDYRPVDLASIPHAEFAQEYGRRQSKRLLHSYGAIRSLERLLELVDEQGFILLSDYGPVQVQRDDDFEHQRFSLATFVGVNFPELRAFFSEGGRGRWVEPGDDSSGTHVRLLGRQPALDTVVRFSECFGKGAQERRQGPLNRARECARVGRFEMAAAAYREALAEQPWNWVVLNEVSLFLTFSLRDVKAGIDLARLALALNPSCSAELWNTLGDALFEFGRTTEARSAYEQALRVSDQDVRARYNLAWVHQRQHDHAAALARIAEALALDKTGQYRERLLHKQQEVLARLAARHQQEYLLLANLVSRHARKGEDKGNAEEPPVTAEALAAAHRERAEHSLEEGR